MRSGWSNIALYINVSQCCFLFEPRESIASKSLSSQWWVLKADVRIQREQRADDWLGQLDVLDLLYSWTNTPPKLKMNHDCHSNNYKLIQQKKKWLFKNQTSVACYVNRLHWTVQEVKCYRHITWETTSTTQEDYTVLGVCIGKNLPIRYVSLYRGNDAIYYNIPQYYGHAVFKTI